MLWANGDKLDGDKYTIERELGRGRWSFTYLARDKSDRRWVIKTLDDSLLNSLTLTERNRLEEKLCNEAIKLKGCNHSHIVKVRELFQEGQRWCIAMEYVDGVSLADRAYNILSENEALGYIQQIGEALIVLHQNHLIHRDVKPGNAIVRVRDGKPEAVLIDFDLAVDFENDLTTARTKEASEGFAPIELYSSQGQSPGEYTDVYSLAATLYELLTGKKPVSAVERKVDGKRLLPPKEINHQISDRVNRAIINGMKLEARDRPQSMREWLDSLGLIGANSTSNLATNSTSNPTTISRLTLEQKLAIAGVIIAVLGLLVAAIGPLVDWVDKIKSDPPISPTSSPTRIE